MTTHLLVGGTSAIYKAAILDMDGTLLHGSNLSSENMAAINVLREYGLRIILATGRNHYHIGHYYRRLELDTPAVTSDGAMVLVPGTGMFQQIVQERTMPAEASSKILAAAYSQQVTCLGFYRAGIRVTSQFDWDHGMERHAEMGPYFLYSSPEAMTRAPLYKTLLYATKPERLDQLQAEIVGEFGAVLDAIRNSPHHLEFIATGVNKVSGLKPVAEMCGFTAEEAIAFGDGVNDLGMFRWAGLSVCMAHGHHSARATATIVAPPSHEATNFAAGVSQVLDLINVRP